MANALANRVTRVVPEAGAATLTRVTGLAGEVRLGLETSIVPAHPAALGAVIDARISVRAALDTVVEKLAWAVAQPAQASALAEGARRSLCAVAASDLAILGHAGVVVSDELRQSLFAILLACCDVRDAHS